MKFEQSGLKNDPLIRKAFDYAQDYNKSLKPEIEAQMKEQLEMSYEMQIARAEAAKDAGKISAEDFDNFKSRMDKQKELTEARIPSIAEQQIGLMFNRAKLAPVLELQQYSENQAPALVAAALLVGTVRDPLDYQKVEETFGGAIAGVVAEIMHIDSYPGSRDANLAAAGADTKRVLLSEITTNLAAVPQQAASAPPGAQLSFPPKMEQTIFRDAKAFWGNDKKLDARLVDTFNAAAALVNSDYRMEVGSENKLELVAGAKAAAPKPPKPGAPKGPSIAGDDGF